MILDFAPIDISRETGFKDVRLDYNGGVRIGIPEGKTAHVVIKDADTDTVLYAGDWAGNKAYMDTVYYINYSVSITIDGETYVDNFDLNGKTVYMHLASVAIGDNIVCLPYIKKFSQLHNCKIIICTTPAIRDLVSVNYPEFEPFDNKDDCFIAPENTYASYILSEFKHPDSANKVPVLLENIDLQYSPAYILGLPIEKLRPELKATKTPKIDGKYVCIAIQASGRSKLWNNLYGWQAVVDYLISLGYKVVCIDRYKIGNYIDLQVRLPEGVIDLTGDIPLQNRVNVLSKADFFIGLSSGLSWIAYGCGCKAIVISGFTTPSKEFPNPYRVFNPHVCCGCEVNRDHTVSALSEICPLKKDWECTRLISEKQVIKMIDRVVHDINAEKELSL